MTAQDSPTSRMAAAQSDLEALEAVLPDPRRLAERYAAIAPTVARLAGYLHGGQWLEDREILLAENDTDQPSVVGEDPAWNALEDHHNLSQHLLRTAAAYFTDPRA